MISYFVLALAGLEMVREITSLNLDDVDDILIGKAITHPTQLAMNCLITVWEQSHVVFYEVVFSPQVIFKYSISSHNSLSLVNNIDDL